MKAEWKVSRQEAFAALSLFRQRQWVLAFVGVVALTVAFVFLGRWQFHRHEAKLARRDLINSNYDAKPVPVDDLLSTGRALSPLEQWRPVAASGTYLPDVTVLIRNRPLDANNGYEVIVPLRTEGGILLVDRGWIPSGATAEKPDSVPAVPTGTVTVTARMRLGEPAQNRPAPVGQAMQIDLPQIERGLHAARVSDPTYPGYGLLVGESPAANPAPTPLPAPDVGLGINLAYAIQWWAFAIAAYVLLAVAAVREVRREAAGGTAQPPPVPAARAAP